MAKPRLGSQLKAKLDVLLKGPKAKSESDKCNDIRKLKAKS